MRPEINQLQSVWENRVAEDFFSENRQKQQSIVRWLLGEDIERLNSLILIDLDNIQPAIEYRYAILRKGYLDVQSSQAYRHLLTRLTALVMRSPYLRSWVEKKHTYQKEIINIIQAVIQEMLEKEPTMQQSINWIAKCTQDAQLREAFFLASLEEYCCQIICNQPRFIRCLRHYLWKKSSKNSLKVSNLIEYRA